MIAPLLAALLTVSPDILVSTDDHTRNHWEVRLGASDRNPNELIACSMAENPSREMDLEYSTTAYLSHDGGRTWAMRAEISKSWDPDCTFSGNQPVFIGMRTTSEAGDDDIHQLRILRSANDGVTWKQVTIQPVVDRPFTVSAPTHNPCRGISSVVVIAAMDKKQNNVYTDRFYRLLPGATSARRTGIYKTIDSAHFGNPGPGLFLPDGRVVYAYEDAFRDVAHAPSHRVQRVVLLSRCGAGVQRITTVAHSVSSESVFDEYGGLPAIARDDSSGPYSGRLYLVWPDARSGAAAILVSHSSDNGKTWTAPQPASDTAFTGKDRSRAHLPCVAVNNRGVVGVSWYDNRGAYQGLGWSERFAVSTDGGRTFSKSIRISRGGTSFRFDRPGKVLLTTQSRFVPGVKSGTANAIGLNQRYALQGGDTAGLVADGNGVFHVLWVDNRTGLSQLWTSIVTVGNAKH